MSEAMELLDSLSETMDDTSGTQSPTYPEQPMSERIIVGEDRFITVPEGLKRIAVQHDHNVETVTFDCPRYWDEHDMSQMRVYVNYQRPDGVTGSCLCEEVWVDETDENLMHFNWTVGGHATAVDGVLRVQVCIKRMKSGDGITETEINHWNSEIYEEMYISKGLDCSMVVPTNQPTQAAMVYYTDNGSYTIVPDDGFVLDKVNVVVSVPEVGRAKINQRYTENGLYVITPPNDECLLEEVRVVVDVDTGSAEPERITKSDVNFYDYDGTVVAAYTIEEAAALEALPTPPEHEGLVSQGWNYDLDTVKTYGRRLDIGAMYVTDDGKTRIYISIEPDTGKNMEIYVYDMSLSGFYIDWGDGTIDERPNSGMYTHTYAETGDYCITVWAYNDTGIISFGPGTVSDTYGITSTGLMASRIRKIELGANVRLTNKCFYQCTRLESITMPSYITVIDNYAFMQCYTLRHITIPSGCTSIGVSTFSTDMALVSASLPTGVTIIDRLAFSSAGLNRIIIPEGVTDIDYSAFSGARMVHTQLPSTIESIGDLAFRQVPSYCMDFRNCTAVPTLSTSSASIGTSYILVPAGLLEEWKTASGWNAYASQIVSELPVE